MLRDPSKILLRYLLTSKSFRSTDSLLMFFMYIYITDQLISTIPFRVYTQLTTLLARDKINIAGRLFNLTLEEAMSLRDNAEHGCLSMDDVFQLMRERHVNLGQLVQVLKEMQRFDALSVLTEAGYRDHPILHPCVASGKVKSACELSGPPG